MFAILFCDTSGLRYAIFVMTSILWIKRSSFVFQPIDANASCRKYVPDFSMKFSCGTLTCRCASLGRPMACWILRSFIVSLLYSMRSAFARCLLHAMSLIYGPLRAIVS